MSKTTDLQEAGETVTLSRRRWDIALEVAFETDKLAQVLVGLVPMDDNQTFYAVRGIAARLVQLASVAMSALSDPSEKVEALSRTLNVIWEQEVSV